MTAGNTAASFGWVARSLHWATALLILVAIPLGVYANGMAFDTEAELAAKAQLFSVHKTLGVAAFLVAVMRILWALTQPRPHPLHPDRKLETTVAETVHWVLYISLVVVPLSGWVHHAAVSGFAPILWPFGQTLPFVPKSESIGAFAGALHWVFTKLLAASILLHVIGALKHHLIDRDNTLRRMTRGIAEKAEVIRNAAPGTSHILPFVLAVALYATGAGLAAALVSSEVTDATESAESAGSMPAEVAGNWQVVEGTLAFTVRQMGQEVPASFAKWTADITFDETATDGRHGTVVVRIDTGSLTLGSVTDQAKGKDFFDTSTFPEALFRADLASATDGYVATGTLSLRGADVPVSLPFTLTIDGDRATMKGTARLDRRDFRMGQAYGDEATVGFFADVSVDLVADRKK